MSLSSQPLRKKKAPATQQPTDAPQQGLTPQVADGAPQQTASSPEQGTEKKQSKNSQHKKKLYKAEHDPRAAALVALGLVLDNKKDSQAALDQVVSSSWLMPTDKRLCTELLYGTLRHYIRLEWFITQRLAKPEKLPKEMLLTLTITLYGMAFLRIPHHASVNWAVSHVSHRFGQGLGKVANGVLRSMQRDIKNLHSLEYVCSQFPTKTEGLACYYSVPAWLAENWCATYSEEQALTLFQAAASTPPVGIRVNRCLPGWEGELDQLTQMIEEQGSKSTTEQADQGQAKAVSVPPCGIACKGSLPWLGKEMVKEGRASLQSCASYAILESFNPSSWQGPVWDVCAGRGGKTLALLEMGVPVTLATDTSERRLSAMKAEYERLQNLPKPIPARVCGPAASLLTGAPLTTLDGDIFATRDAFFGTIVIDAPCSGLGTLSKRPEIRLRRTPQDIATLAATQATLLDCAHSHLLPGGRILYLTCTMTHEENQGQIQAFLEKHPDMELEQEEQTQDISTLCECFYGALLRQKS